MRLCIAILVRTRRLEKITQHAWDLAISPACYICSILQLYSRICPSHKKLGPNSQFGLDRGLCNSESCRVKLLFTTDQVYRLGIQETGTGYEMAFYKATAHDGMQKARPRRSPVGISVVMEPFVSRVWKVITVTF
jgi:hypothetical protein